jgi:2-phosphosulfolactate phosphatase
MTPFDQRVASCRCEWGIIGHDHLASADVTIIVDVLSFSTCVDVAVSRGAAIIPYAWEDVSARAFTVERGAELAGRRDTSRYSLSPFSFLDAPAGLRCVLPSPNGAALAVRAASTSAKVFAGCLRNAAAVARAAAHSTSVRPGERWPDGSLRPAIEDWLGAGAILCHLPGTKSPEAIAAITAFERAGQILTDVIAQAGSGRELIERGFVRDVELAAALDVSRQVPRYDGTAFVAQESAA